MTTKAGDSRTPSALLALALVLSSVSVVAQLVPAVRRWAEGQRIHADSVSTLAARAHWARSHEREGRERQRATASAMDRADALLLATSDGRAATAGLVRAVREALRQTDATTDALDVRVDSVDAGGLRRLSARVELHATTASVADALAALEAHAPRLSVRELSVSRASESGSGDPSLIVTMQIDALMADAARARPLDRPAGQP